MVHNTAQNSSDNLPSYPPDLHMPRDLLIKDTANKLEWRTASVAVLEESPCPRGPLCKSLYLDYKSLSLDHKVLENCQGHCILHVSREVTATMHEVKVKNGLLTYIRYYSLIK